MWNSIKGLTDVKIESVRQVIDDWRMLEHNSVDEFLAVI